MPIADRAKMNQNGFIVRTKGGGALPRWEERIHEPTAHETGRTKPRRRIPERMARRTLAQSSSTLEATPKVQEGTLSLQGFLHQQAGK